jgi:hypothetical protein
MAAYRWRMFRRLRRTYAYRSQLLFDVDGRQLVDDKTYALERVHDLLAVALNCDANRRWFSFPNRLWVGHARHALTLVEQALAADEQQAG